MSNPISETQGQERCCVCGEPAETLISLSFNPDPDTDKAPQFCERCWGKRLAKIMKIIKMPRRT